MAQDGIRIEAAHGSPGRHSVHGPEEQGYGRPLFGWVHKEERGWRAYGLDPRLETRKADLGPHRSLGVAAKAVAEWAERNLTAKALSAEFENRTAGGWPIRFLRRTASSLVAVTRPPGGKEFQTSWAENGDCSLYADAMDGTRFADLLRDSRLVRRAPSTDAGAAPAPERGCPGAR